MDSKGVGGLRAAEDYTGSPGSESEPPYTSDDSAPAVANTVSPNRDVSFTLNADSLVIYGAYIPNIEGICGLESEWFDHDDH